MLRGLGWPRLDPVAVARQGGSSITRALRVVEAVAVAGDGVTAKAGNSADPNGAAAHRDAGGSADPDGAAAHRDAGTNLDPNG